MDDNDTPLPELAEPTGPLTNDSAVALLGKIGNTDAAPSQPRAPNGQFTPKETAETVVEDEKVVDIKTGKPAEAVAEEPPAEAEDDYFEFPGENEGDEPRRVKLDEVLAAYEEVPKLRADLETARKATPVPPDYQSALQDTVRARSEYMRGLEIVATLLNPQDPSLDMLDQNSQNYDPQRYYDLKAKADRERQQLASLRKQHDEAQKQQSDEQQVLVKAAMARERAAIDAAWPEFQQEATRKSVAEGLAQTYGFTPEEIRGIADHRHFLVIRDALELRALKAKQAEAVKVVRQKPKLVKGAARTTTNPGAAKGAAAMQNLQRTGSTDAAVAAMRALKL